MAQLLAIFKVAGGCSMHRTERREPVLGKVDVRGEIYEIAPVGMSAYEAVRSKDGCRVGTFLSSASWMWEIRAELVDADVLQEIIDAAMESGVFPPDPSD
jgi:hypothetical protein